MKRDQLVILHMGMLKTASTFLQRAYWQNYKGNCGKPLDNKTADLTVRLELIIERLETSEAEIKVVSDEALLTGGETHEKYKLQLLSYLSDATVVPFVVTQRPSSLLNSAISYFAKGRLFPNFDETAQGLTRRFPRLLAYLDFPELEKELWRNVGTPILLDIRQLNSIHSVITTRLGRDLNSELLSDFDLSNAKPQNKSSISRRMWTQGIREKTRLFESMPEAGLVMELDKKYDKWVSTRNA